jgi:hypothetical protein
MEMAEWEIPERAANSRSVIPRLSRNSRNFNPTSAFIDHRSGQYFDHEENK